MTTPGLIVDANNDPPADIRAAITRLRDQVDDLQHLAAVQKKPWYRTSSTITSIIALAFSVVTGTYSLWTNANHDAHAKHDSLGKILQDIISLRVEGSNSKLAAMSQGERAEIGPLLNTKRTVLLAKAKAIVREIGDKVTAAEFNVLANEHASESDFTQAETYFVLAKQVAEPGISRSIALRSLGVFYFEPTPLRNVASGRELLRSAADEVRKASDPYSRYALALALHMWALAELRDGSVAQAGPIVEEARATYQSISAHPYGRWGLEDFERALQMVPR